MYRDDFNKGTGIKSDLTVGKAEFYGYPLNPQTGINECGNPVIGRNMFPDLPSEYTIEFENGSKIKAIPTDKSETVRGKGYYYQESEDTENVVLGTVYMDEEGYFNLEFKEYIEKEFTDKERKIMQDKANDILSIVFKTLERVYEKESEKDE
jgi:hypothetical protein